METLDLSFTPLKEGRADTSLFNISIVSSADLTFSELQPKRVGHLSTDRSLSTNCFNLTPHPHTFSQSKLVTDESFDEEPSTGYEIDRFLDSPDPYFICRTCNRVACDPIECKTCRNLVCGACALTNNECPSGCEKFKFLKANPFVTECLNSLVLHCRYEGCRVACAVQDIRIHEQCCPNREAPCCSPLCDTLVFGNERYCSTTCQLIDSFSQGTKSCVKQEKLQEFAKLMQHAHGLLYEEARGEYATTYAALNKIGRDFLRMKQRKQKLAAQLSVLRRNYHIGKYKEKLGYWTCCRSTDKEARGCIALA